MRASHAVHSNPGADAAAGAGGPGCGGPGTDRHGQDRSVPGRPLQGAFCGTHPRKWTSQELHFALSSSPRRASLPVQITMSRNPRRHTGLVHAGRLWRRRLREAASPAHRWGRRAHRHARAADRLSQAAMYSTCAMCRCWLLDEADRYMFDLGFIAISATLLRRLPPPERRLVDALLGDAVLSSA